MKLLRIFLIEFNQKIYKAYKKSMATYFEVLPQDVRLVILLKVDDMVDLVRLRGVTYFNEVFSLPIFWKTKIKEEYPFAIYTFLPDYLKTFSTDPIKNFITYGVLSRGLHVVKFIVIGHYEYIKDYKEDLINEDGAEVFSDDLNYSLSHVNNVDALFVGSITEDQKIRIMNFYSLYRIKNIIVTVKLYNNEKYKVTVNPRNVNPDEEKISYNISHGDALAILTYIITVNADLHS